MAAHSSLYFSTYFSTFPLFHCFHFYWGTIAAFPWRSTYFWILPVAVFGSSVDERDAVRRLEVGEPLADEVDQLAIGRGGARLQDDEGMRRLAPAFVARTPTTPTSCTAGWRISTPSTSTDEMFSPPLMMTSLKRSRISA